MTTTVICINGTPASGKDTFVNICKERISPAINRPIYNVSSIDCVRNALGISQEDKRPETRDVLAKVGMLLEEYNGFRTRGTLGEIESIHTHKWNQNPIIFVHIRERKMRDRIFAKLEGKCKLIDLFIIRDVAMEPVTNESDMEVYERSNKYKNMYEKYQSLFSLYDAGDYYSSPYETFVIANDVSLVLLEERAKMFLLEYA